MSGEAKMQVYEYKVIPAPSRSEKTRDAKSSADRFASTLAGVMNALGREGWEYLRADTLPSEERSGFTKRVTVYHSVLVFRRPATKSDEAGAAPRKLLTAEAPAGKAPLVGVAANPAPKKSMAAPDPAPKSDPENKPETTDKN